MIPVEKVITRNWGTPQSHALESYRRSGGYRALKKALEMTPEQVTHEVKKSNLRGRGGAGFYTGLKWSFVPKGGPKPKYIAVNADESEPGTFKDRYILEKDPHMLIEGSAIACKAVDAHHCFIYIRGEFGLAYQRILAAVEEAYREGVLGQHVLGTDFQLDMVVHRGAGAYICGEETALLESLEGKKGQPRL